MSRRAIARAATPVPVFFLFGEPPRASLPRFLHLETLEERSRPSNWNIRPHAHLDLHHLFLITHGAGRMVADKVEVGFAAPCLLIVPAPCVHGFAWAQDAQGHVLTLAHDTLRDLVAREPDFAPLFGRPACLPVTDAPALREHLAAVGRELAWSACGHAAAIRGRLQIICVEALRLQQQAARQAAPVPDHAAGIVARFRELVDAHYRSGTPLDGYAARLAVSPSTLRRACLQAASCPPSRILHDRILLEAQRALLFTNMSVKEAAATLGFEDSAYFTRFFTRRAGTSPRAFRAAERGGSG